jgi:hypothetical protein
VDGGAGPVVGEDELVDLEVAASGLVHLRGLLALVEGGEVDATDAERAHLEGAVALLGRLLDQNC